MANAALDDALVEAARVDIRTSMFGPDAGSPPTHEFVATTFFKPTNCEHCESLLWGVRLQGLRCTRCELTCHEGCVGGLVAPCLPLVVCTDSCAAPHEWAPRHFSRASFCNLCRRLLVGVGKQGVTCLTCGLVAHNECAPRMPHACRVHSISEAVAELTRPTLPPHSLVEGNVPHLSRHCCVCAKSTQSQTALTAFHCTGCRMSVHSACASAMRAPERRVCALGPLAPFKLPPSSVVAGAATSGAMPRLRAHPMADATPLLVLLNSRSGGQQGAALLAQFRRLLSPAQVFDLADGGPAPGLRAFASVPSFRVLACGGDGTVGWVMSALETFAAETGLAPPLGVLPLGTGNDFSRALGWGPGYTGESLVSVLAAQLLGRPMLFDRWDIALAPVGAAGVPVWTHRATMNNYFSVGVDAKIALAFHAAREANPDAFKSRTRNKLFYAKAGLAATTDGCGDLVRDLQISCDGGAPLVLPPIQAVIVLNLASYAGGTNLWGVSPPEPFVPVSATDRLLEVVGVTSSVHLGRIKAGLGTAFRLAQCAVVEMRWTAPYAMQVDGEPWMQEPTRVLIRAHPERATVLAHPTRYEAQDFGEDEPSDPPSDDDSSESPGAVGEAGRADADM